MPITLSDTSITGLAVGGLPTGTVNSTVLADAAVTRAKMGYTGAVLQTVFAYTHSTTSWGGNSASNFEAYITPTSTSSYILIMGVLSGHASDDSYSYLQYNIGGGSWTKGGGGMNGPNYLGGWGDHCWSHGSNSGPFQNPCFTLINFGTTSQVGIRWCVNAEATFYQNRGTAGATWDGYEGGSSNPNFAPGISTLILQEIRS